VLGTTPQHVKQILSRKWIEERVAFYQQHTPAETLEAELVEAILDLIRSENQHFRVAGARLALQYLQYKRPRENESVDPVKELIAYLEQDNGVSER